MILKNLIPTSTLEEQVAFEKKCYLATWIHLKKKGFPVDQGRFFKMIDDNGLTEENLQPLGWEVAGRNLVQISGTKVIA
jgi:hypothetical protein